MDAQGAGEDVQAEDEAVGFSTGGSAFALLGLLVSMLPLLGAAFAGPGGGSVVPWYALFGSLAVLGPVSLVIGSASHRPTLVGLA